MGQSGHLFRGEKTLGIKTTLGQLKADIRDVADADNSNFVDDTQLTSRINKAAARFYDTIIKKDPTYSLQTAALEVGSDGLADLPDDFYKVQGVDFYLNGQWVELAEWNFQERNKYKNQTKPLYRLRNDQIQFLPPTGTGAQLQIHYNPSFTPLEDDDDELDTINGWDEMIIHQVAIGIKEKGEEDTSTLERQLQRSEQHVQDMSGDRDYSRPERVTDVTGRYPGFGGLYGDWDEY